MWQMQHDAVTSPCNRHEVVWQLAGFAGTGAVLACMFFCLLMLVSAVMCLFSRQLQYALPPAAAAYHPAINPQLPLLLLLPHVQVLS
jgi:hypothetical protein